MFVVGVFGGSQIVGSIEYAKIRPPIATAITIILWSVILIAAIFVVINWFSDSKLPLLVGLGIGCVLSIRHQER